MQTDDRKIQPDYPVKNKEKSSFLRIITYISIVFVLILSSSYKYPNQRVGSKLVKSHSNQIQELVKMRIQSIQNLLIADTSYNINNEINSLLVDFYTQRNFHPAWLDNFTPNQKFTSLMFLLDSAAYFGFPYDYFFIEDLHELSYISDNQFHGKEFLSQKVDLEIMASYASLKFMLFIKHGIFESELTNIDVAQTVDFSKILNEAINENGVRTGVLSVQPDLVQHQNLLTSLSFFIDLHYSVKYTTPAFIDDKLLAKSMYYAGITDSPEFSAANLKSEALYRLSPNYNSGKDSILNIPTHESLVSLLEYRYYQACLNLNRLRKLNHSGDNYLFVNIPEFKLHVVESNKAMEAFNVIVGRTYTPTPTFTSAIEKVVANPYWTVPKSIVNNEMLHKIRTDSTYLERNGYFVIDNQEEFVHDSAIDWNSNDPLGNQYWLRQNNNNKNALGQVKFVFPNEYRVFVHDTQAKRLFERDKRTFSHGCIRLENPDKLAQYITDKYNSEEKNIRSLISEKERHVIELSENLQIHIQYITCSVDNNSEIVFHEDVYNKDNLELQEVFPQLVII